MRRKTCNPGTLDGSVNYVENVDARVWKYEMSGKQVLLQWFSYRKANRERPTIGERRTPSPLTSRPNTRSLRCCLDRCPNACDFSGASIQLSLTRSSWLPATSALRYHRRLCRRFELRRSLPGRERCPPIAGPPTLQALVIAPENCNRSLNGFFQDRFGRCRPTGCRSI
jgi:hypothetical protein